MLVLGPLSLVESLTLVVPVRARVGHALVEPQPIEVIAEIVVVSNVLPRSFLAVAVLDHMGQEPTFIAGAQMQLLHDRLKREADERLEVSLHVEPPAHVGFPEAQRAAGEHIAQGCRRVEAQEELLLSFAIAVLGAIPHPHAERHLGQISTQLLEDAVSGRKHRCVTPTSRRLPDRDDNSVETAVGVSCSV